MPIRYNKKIKRCAQKDRNNITVNYIKVIRWTIIYTQIIRPLNFNGKKIKIIKFHFEACKLITLK